MVSTSVVTSPSCREATAVGSCCSVSSDTGITVGGGGEGTNSEGGGWPKIKTSACNNINTGGDFDAAHDRCIKMEGPHTRPSKTIVGAAATLTEKVKSSSVAVGAVDFVFGGGNSHALLKRDKGDMLVLRRVQSVGNRKGLPSHCYQAATALLPRVVGGGGGGTTTPRELKSASVAGARVAGTGKTGWEEAKAESLSRMLGENELHHPLLCEDGSGTPPCRNSGLVMGSNSSNDEEEEEEGEEEEDQQQQDWGALCGNSKLSSSLVGAGGTSCPDFLLFCPHPSSSKKADYSGTAEKNAEDTIVYAAAAEAMNGLCGNGTCGGACGGACISTDDERPSNYNNQGHEDNINNVLKKQQRLASPTTGGGYSIEVHTSSEAAGVCVTGVREVLEMANASLCFEQEGSLVPTPQAVSFVKAVATGTAPTNVGGTSGRTTVASLSEGKSAAPPEWVPAADVSQTSQGLCFASEKLVSADEDGAAREVLSHVHGVQSLEAGKKSIGDDDAQTVHINKKDIKDGCNDAESNDTRGKKDIEDGNAEICSNKKDNRLVEVAAPPFPEINGSASAQRGEGPANESAIEGGVAAYAAMSVLTRNVAWAKAAGEGHTTPITAATTQATAATAQAIAAVPAPAPASPPPSPSTEEGGAGAAAAAAPAKHEAATAGPTEERAVVAAAAAASALSEVTAARAPAAALCEGGGAAVVEASAAGEPQQQVMMRQAAAESGSGGEGVAVGVEEGRGNRITKTDERSGHSRTCRSVDAAVLFPVPQPPSLPQLLQLPDVYEAAVLALRVLPERYKQRIQQLDALETLCPCVYMRCSYLARVRQIYMISTELMLNKKDMLLQQLAQERSSKQRSRKGGLQLQRQQHERDDQQNHDAGERIIEVRNMEQDYMEDEKEEDDDEDGSLYDWSGDREQHKALYAVADLFMEVKAVQVRVGPTLLAGAAQLAEALRAISQQQQQEAQKSSNQGPSFFFEGKDDDGFCCANDNYSIERGERPRIHINCNCSKSDRCHKSISPDGSCMGMTFLGSNNDRKRANDMEGGKGSLESFINDSSRGCQEKKEGYLNHSVSNISKNDDGSLNSVSDEIRREGGEKSAEDSSSSSSSSSMDGARLLCIGRCCKGVQALVDNFLHSFFSCRVAAELQREHFLLAVQSGDCGAILTSCLPMEKLIFQAALDAQELALHHLGIAAPVEVWVGEAGDADEQLRAFLLASSVHEGPIATAWSACSSPCQRDISRNSPSHCDTGARLVTSSAEQQSAVQTSTVSVEEDNGKPSTTCSVLTQCSCGHVTLNKSKQQQQEQEQQQREQEQQQRQQQEGAKTGMEEKGRSLVLGEAGSQNNNSRCTRCRRPNCCCGAATKEVYQRSCMRDRLSNTNTFARPSSHNRGASALPGTIRFPCFASYAYSGIFELLKNSMRASVEAWRLNRFARATGNNAGSNNAGSSTTTEGKGSSKKYDISNDGGSYQSRTPKKSDDGNDYKTRDGSQQRWRLLSVERSRKLKKLPGRVRLQRCCMDSTFTRQRSMMACNGDLAAAADDARAARLRFRNEKKSRFVSVESQQHHSVEEVEKEENAALQTEEDEEEICCEVVQLEEGVLQPIKVLLLFVDESLIIRIEDHGEGLRQKELQNVWSFAYTTAACKGLLQQLAAAGDDDDHNSEGSAATERSSAQRRTTCSSAQSPVPPLAGCGVGLPMSRVHAQSLGGDIFLESAEGYVSLCLSVPLICHPNHVHALGA